MFRIGPCTIAESIVTAILVAFLGIIGMLCAYTIYDAAFVNQEASAGVYSTRTDSSLGSAYRAARSANEDVIGWIRLDGTGVSQPIVQGSDNSYYLNHDAQRNDSFGGACFLDSRADAAMSSGVPVIFGHNMAQSAMFGDVAAYASEAGFLAGHATGCLCVQGAWFETRALCVLSCSESDRAIYDCLDDGPKQEFCDACKRLCVAKTHDPRMSDRLIALSTCSANGAGRIVLVLAIGDEMPSLAESPLAS